jgi:hypothetical protein
MLSRKTSKEQCITTDGDTNEDTADFEQKLKKFISSPSAVSIWQPWRLVFVAAI